MKAILWIFPVGIAAVLVFNCTQTPAPPDTLTAEQQVKRGEYLVTTMLCNDCHSPKIMTEAGPIPDTTRLLSGHPADMPLATIMDKEAVRKGDWVLMSSMFTAFAGPWGVSYAANLTPDASGTGSWTFEQFKKAFTEGKYKGLDGGRALLPPMPWQFFAKMTDEDLKAIFAYIQSLPPVKNVVPAPVPPNEI